MEKNLCHANRFWSKVKKTKDCWNWNGAKFSSGYGAFWLNGKNKSAHRVSWELTNGQIPDGKLVCHTCDISACVNPNHLFLGTWKGNMEDRDKKGRNYQFSKMLCENGNRFNNNKRN